MSPEATVSHQSAIDPEPRDDWRGFRFIRRRFDASGAPGGTSGGRIEPLARAYLAISGPVAVVLAMLYLSGQWAG